MALKLVTAPAEEPVTLAEAKSQVRVDTTDDDTLITALIATAREVVEGIARRALITQTWELVLDEWPESAEIDIPLPPLQSVTSVTYYDENGNSAVFDAANYIVDVDSEPGRIVLKSSASWPSTTLQAANGIRIRFVCGFGTAADVPLKYKQAMQLLIGHWYENREEVATSGAVPKDVPFGVNALLWLDRNMGF